jgi:DNA-directed RNA polymerase specialized sigma subunit
MKRRFTGREAAAANRAGANKRKLTIQNLIANVRAKTGRTPTDEEIASYLAMSVRRVRLHLRETPP